MQAVGASEKVFEFLDREPTIIHEEGKLTPESLKGTLEFRNVSFSYPSRADTKVLHVSSRDILNTIYTSFRGIRMPLSSSYNISGLVPACWLLFQCF